MLNFCPSGASMPSCGPLRPVPNDTGTRKDYSFKWKEPKSGQSEPHTPKWSELGREPFRTPSHDFVQLLMM